MVTQNDSDLATPPAADAWVSESRERLRFAAAVLGVGIAAAVFAIVFRATLAGLYEYVYGARDILHAFEQLPRWLRILAPVAGGVLTGTVALLAARRGAAHGVGNVMEAVVLGRLDLSLPVATLRSLATWLAIGSGGSVGREGPLILWGGTVGRSIGAALGLDAGRLRLLVAAGTAAGFAAAYNTPFAAVLFVLEIVTGVVALDVLVPTMMATAISTGITRAVVGGGPIYGQRAFALASGGEVVAYALLGVAAAVVGLMFMRTLTWGEQLFERVSISQPWRAAIGALGVGLLASVLPQVTGNGYEPLNRLLDGQLSLSLIAVLIVAKSVATTASVSSGSPGGVFTAGLFIGGALGALWGALVTTLFGLPATAAGGYELVGMAAMTAATTHAPLMAAVMVFELTRDYALVLPLVFATAVATWVSSRARQDSIYTAELRRRGIAWHMTIEGRQIVRGTS